ncbi:hypothetical protein BD413DRAFT_268041 [Trametes elegans]|nr:hypothetical protein BD413DRAFT_268041 [Trametes elegans]
MRAHNFRPHSLRHSHRRQTLRRMEVSTAIIVIPETPSPAVLRTGGEDTACVPDACTPPPAEPEARVHRTTAPLAQSERCGGLQHVSESQGCGDWCAGQALRAPYACPGAPSCGWEAGEGEYRRRAARTCSVLLPRLPNSPFHGCPFIATRGCLVALPATTLVSGRSKQALALKRTAWGS